MEWRSGVGDATRRSHGVEKDGFVEELGPQRMTEPKRWAEERKRGMAKATKSGVSLQYLGLRVAPEEGGVNPWGEDF
jgi:hypothetical protein